MRGSIELKMSQFTDAIASYTRVVQLDPAGPDGTLGLADAQFAAGMNKEASASFEAALRQFPKDARVKLQYALMLLKEAETGTELGEPRYEELLRYGLALERYFTIVIYRCGYMTQ